MNEKPTREVWYVAGDEGNLLFETKMDAEIYARQLYPNLDPFKRYAYIGFKQVWSLSN